MDKKRFTVVAVGRLSKEKNYPLLLNAIALLNQRGVDLQCLIIGDGSEKASLLDMAEANELSNVVFTGAKSNPYADLGQADLYVSSSVYEGLSTTTIEALILGRPCVVTDCAGMRSILGEHNEYGVVVPMEASALADAIEKMISDPEWRAHYARQAVLRSSFFDPEQAFSKIEAQFY